MQVAHDTEVGNREDGSIFILVDSHDIMRLLHTSQVLDSAGDTASHVEVRANGFTGLAYLISMVHHAGIHHSTR